MFKKYLDELKQPSADRAMEVRSLPVHKRGWKVMLGEQLDAKGQNYVQDYIEYHYGCW